MQRQSQSINYRDIVKEWLLTKFKFIKQEKYVLSDEDYIFRKLKKMIKIIKKRFDKCNSKKYSHKEVNSKDFQYVKQIQKQDESFSLKKLKDSSIDKSSKKFN